MLDGSLLIVRGAEIASLLDGRELQIIEAVGHAYSAHAAGDSSLPHSTFLRFPNDDLNRIIALPAYLGGDFATAGIKWVSSFPGNLKSGTDRASAAIILNHPTTGRPVAFIEGSLISAKRTAASAALAAKHLHVGRGGATTVGLVGAGLINFEIARFLLAAMPENRDFLIFDLHAERARAFAKKCREAFPNVSLEVAEDTRAVLRNCPLISFATTAIKPHVFDLSECRPSSTILHISLRDLAPEAILNCDNVVDDVDHVCRAQTSIHLAEQLAGHRDFIRCTLADILQEHAAARLDDESVAVFSPFGLGVLDLAVAKNVFDAALKQKMGTVIESFLPDSWRDERPEKSE